MRGIYECHECTDATIKFPTQHVSNCHCSRHVTGQSSKEIAIASRLFDDGFKLYDGMDTYKVELWTAWPEGSPNGDETARVYTILTLNKVCGACAQMTILPPDDACW